MDFAECPDPLELIEWFDKPNELLTQHIFACPECCSAVARIASIDQCRSAGPAPDGVLPSEDSPADDPSVHRPTRSRD